jgi:hypothetical protein
MPVNVLKGNPAQRAWPLLVQQRSCNRGVLVLHMKAGDNEQLHHTSVPARCANPRTVAAHRRANAPYGADLSTKYRIAADRVAHDGGGASSLRAAIVAILSFYRMTR